MDNVAILDGHDVMDILAAQPDRVTGARVYNRGTGEERILGADLVVDATGRAARTPAFLESLGYDRPEEERVDVQVGYASWLLRIPQGTITEKMILVGAEPSRPTGGALFAYEHDTWMLTLIGIAGHEPPTDWADAVPFAAEFAPPALLAALRGAEPITEACHYRYPASRWRRYDKLRRFPTGLLVFGDAICSFNPVYGQGMSVAALEAIALRDCLVRGNRDLSRRFFRAAAKTVGVVWQMSAGADLALPQVEGRRSLSISVSNRYTHPVLTTVLPRGAPGRLAGPVPAPVIRRAGGCRQSPAHGTHSARRGRTIPYRLVAAFARQRKPAVRRLLHQSVHDQ